MELVRAPGCIGVPGAEMIGANAEAIATAEDRERFKQAMIEIGLSVPAQRHRPHDGRGVRQVVAEIGLPIIIRPAYILGGRGTGIASTTEEFEKVAAQRPRRQPDQRDPHREERSPAGRSTSSRSCAIAPTTA
jgi:carbamoyl-phosphate synthase large subunit